MFLSSALRSLSTITLSTSFSSLPGLNKPCRRSASQQIDSVLPLPAEWLMRNLQPMSPCSTKRASAASATRRTMRPWW